MYTISIRSKRVKCHKKLEWKYTVKNIVNRDFRPSKDGVDHFSFLLPLSTTFNSGNEARDNKMRSLKNDNKNVSWFETPGLEEQHSSRWLESSHPKKEATQTSFQTPNLTTGGSPGRLILFLIEWESFWQHQASLTLPVRGIDQSLTKNNWPE